LAPRTISGRLLARGRQPATGGELAQQFGQTKSSSIAWMPRFGMMVFPHLRRRLHPHLCPRRHQRCRLQYRLHSPRHTRRGHAFHKLIVTSALGAMMISRSSVLRGGKQARVAASRNTAQPVLGQPPRRRRLHSPLHRRRPLRHRPPHSPLRHHQLHSPLQRHRSRRLRRRRASVAGRAVVMELALQVDGAAVASPRAQAAAGIGVTVVHRRARASGVDSGPSGKPQQPWRPSEACNLPWSPSSGCPSLLFLVQCSAVQPASAVK